MCRPGVAGPLNRSNTHCGLMAWAMVLELAKPARGKVDTDMGLCSWTGDLERGFKRIGGGRRKVGDDPAACETSRDNGS